MESKSSKESSPRFSRSGSTASSSSWNHYPESVPYHAQQGSYVPTPHHHYAPPPSQLPKRNRRFSQIADDYRSLDEVTKALIQAGLESSNLIVGIDFTKSNEWTGSRSFGRKSLHNIGTRQNPYEQAISIIGKTLSAFDEDNLIPCFGFGDASTHDQDVFSFYPDDCVCTGFEEVLTRYREIVPSLRLAGPTSFAPIIEMAMTIVEQRGGQYHVLLIIADGQVTRSMDTQHGQLSLQEQRTINAIVRASNYPLSIVLVGVGDGPWDLMKEFDDNIPSRAFDNLQFVNFTEIMSKNVDITRKRAEFALSALMEIPSQYKATIELGLLGVRNGNSPDRIPLPPPAAVSTVRNNTQPYTGYGSSSFQQRTAPPQTGYDAGVSAPPYSTYDNQVLMHQHSSCIFINKQIYKNLSISTVRNNTQPYTGYSSSSFQQRTAPPQTGYDAGVSAPPYSTYDNQVCPICLTNPKDMAFGCGHQTCCNCGEYLQVCPICLSSIQTRIKLL